jgi:hypothetical protein
MKKIIGLSFIVLALGLFSCNNENTDVATIREDLSEKSAAIAVAEVQVEATTTEAESEVEFFANAELLLTEWWRMGKKFGWHQSHKMRYMAQCPDVVIEEGENDGYPKTITLNYGDSTVLRNGHVLSGEIIIEISAPRRSQDYMRTITYNAFGKDSVVVSGTSIVEVDKVDEMFRKFTSNLIITISDTTVITRESERIWQWIAGLDTDDHSDDVITISGSASAEMEGIIYKKEITTPLKRIGDCRYIVEGIIEITLNGDVICTMDYGDGTCDEIAEMTNADGTTEIDLSEHKVKCKCK